MSQLEMIRKKNLQMNRSNLPSLTKPQHHLAASAVGIKENLHMLLERGELVRLHEKHVSSLRSKENSII